MSWQAHGSRLGRARLAAVITILCLGAGCDNPLAEEFGEPDEQTRRDVEKCGREPSDKLAAPPGSYIDQGLTIDYERLRRDQDYKVIDDPRLLEQVYADAVGGNVTARWSVCLFEAVSRGGGRRAAELLAGLGCQTIANCRFPQEKLPYSDTTASGVRMLTLIADDFEAEAKRLQVTQEILGHALTLFVGTRVVSARVKAGTAPATILRPAPYRPTPTKPASSGTTAGAASAAKPVSKPASSGTTAGAASAVAKPAYKPFTRANFRYNLAQRTGGIPDKAQAHHVLPVKFEEKFSKAGINIHDPKFGAWWKAGDHQSVAKAYNKKWQDFFDTHSNPTSEQILQKGREIAKEYGLAIGF